MLFRSGFLHLPAKFYRLKRFLFGEIWREKIGWFEAKEEKETGEEEEQRKKKESREERRERRPSG